MIIRNGSKTIWKASTKNNVRTKGIIKYWDQDVLNKFFDGKYLKLLEGMNKNLTI